VLSAWHSLDLKRAVWIEDEGPFIGAVGVPQPIRDAIEHGIVIELGADVETRIARLLEEYGSVSRADLEGAIRVMRARLGAERSRRAIQAIRAGRLREAIRAVLPYYDSAYRHRMDRLQRPVAAAFRSWNEACALLCVGQEPTRVLAVHVTGNSGGPD
jgi:hypothetical protein